jgi:hypothetical protein
VSQLQLNQDILKKLRQKFGQVRTSQGKNGIEYIVDCTECGGKAKCYVNPKMGLYICFKCGEKGPISRIIKYEHQAFETSANYAPTPLPENVSLPGMMMRLVHLEDDHPAAVYLNRRGFDLQELDDVFGVRYCHEGRAFAHGLFNTSNTLVFPIWQDGELVGWQARLLYTPEEMSEDEMEVMGFLRDSDGDFIKPPKYWTNPGLPKGRVFFNFDWAKMSDLVVVTEGVFDAMAVGRCGVATLGKGVTQNQINRLKEWPLVVLLLDPGDADKEMVDLTYALNRDTRVLPVKLSGYKDAGEAPRYDIWAQIADHALQAKMDLTQLKIIV